jgi:hypothetical protein
MLLHKLLQFLSQKAGTLAGLKLMLHRHCVHVCCLVQMRLNRVIEEQIKNQRARETTQHELAFIHLLLQAK